MAATPTPATPAAPGRRTTLQWVDLVVGLLLTLIVGFIGLLILAYITQLSGLAAACDGVTPDGARCDPGFLNAMIIIGYAVVVFAWFLGLGWLIVRAVRRQLLFWVPLVSGVVIIAAFYALSIVLGSSYLPAT